MYISQMINMYSNKSSACIEKMFNVYLKNIQPAFNKKLTCIRKRKTDRKKRNQKGDREKHRKEKKEKNARNLPESRQNWEKGSANRSLEASQNRFWAGALE